MGAANASSYKYHCAWCHCMVTENNDISVVIYYIVSLDVVQTVCWLCSYYNKPTSFILFLSMLLLLAFI